jgi:6-pyruvoyltetrahydropterin/6-carboxytetrahydropterin synthase
MSAVTIVYCKKFCASHRLHSPHLSDEENRKVYGKCNYPNGHGHNYVMDISLRGIPDPKTGMIVNFFDLNRILDEKIMTKVDHRHFNFDVSEFKTMIPTVENIVRVLWQWLKPELGELLYEIHLHETDYESAYYRGE